MGFQEEGERGKPFSKGALSPLPLGRRRPPPQKRNPACDDSRGPGYLFGKLVTLARANLPPVYLVQLLG